MALMSISFPWWFVPPAGFWLARLSSLLFAEETPKHITQIGLGGGSFARWIDSYLPVERAILMQATFELKDLQEIPYRVVINEAVELAKNFGGTDGYKYVNGVLDRIAPSVRPHEVRPAG